MRAEREGKRRVIDHFDVLAPRYDRLIGPPDLTRLRALLDLPTAGWVLDVGGGTGRIVAQLRPLAGQLMLLDRSQPMLRQAQDKGLWPIQSDVARLPLHSGLFATDSALYCSPFQPLEASVGAT